jgi:ABC-type multidrug transport system permease subunit
MKFVKIAIKGFKELVRDKRLLAMMLLFPVVFMLVFGYAFGVGGGQNTPNVIVVLNNDIGTSSSTIGSGHFNFGENFTQVLRDLKYENSTVSMLTLQNATREDALKLLKERSIACIVTIPENFSEAMQAAVNSTVRTTVTSVVGETVITLLQQMGGLGNATTFPSGGLNFTLSGALPEAVNITAMISIEGDRGYINFDNFTFPSGGMNFTLPGNLTTAENITATVSIEGDRGYINFDNSTFPSGIMNSTLPGNATLNALPEAENITAMVSIEGDMGYMNFGITQSIVRGVLSSYVEVVQSEAKNQVMQAVPLGTNIGENLKYVSVDVESVSGTRAFTAFDYQAPGIIVFGLLMGSIGVAGALSRETEAQTLSRLKVSLMRPFDLLFGTLLPWALLAVAQLLILFGVALAMGFHWVGGTSSLLIAVLIGFIAGLACISLGLLVAAFSKSESHATNLGIMISVPISFLVGAFFPLPAGAGTVTFFLPWRQACTALISVLTSGASLQQVMPNITAMIIETAILFTLGVIVFAKIRLKAE